MQAPEQLRFPCRLCDLGVSFNDTWGIHLEACGRGFHTLPSGYGGHGVVCLPASLARRLILSHRRQLQSSATTGTFLCCLASRWDIAGAQQPRIIPRGMADFFSFLGFGEILRVGFSVHFMDLSVTFLPMVLVSARGDISLDAGPLPCTFC